MKLSNILAVLAVSAALVTTGCRYDKSGEEAGQGAGAASGAEAVDIGTDEFTDEELSDDASQSGNLADLQDGARFEDIYARCNDVSFEPVYFGFDSTVIPQGELGKVDAVAQHLADNPNRVVVVEGHCDDRGSNEYNMSLGESRASIVRS